jgi:hypothetical protein
MNHVYSRQTLIHGAWAMRGNNKIMLIDLDDERRDTRIRLLEQAGYEVTMRSTYIEANRQGDEASFDLIILALHHGSDGAVSYSDRLSRNNPGLPILLLSDQGVYVPRGTLSKNLEAGSPIELIREIAAMLAGSAHIREIPADMSSVG